MDAKAIISVINVLLPVGLSILERVQAQSEKEGVPMPTGPELEARIKREFESNVAHYLGEGAAWRAAHPNA